MKRTSNCLTFLLFIALSLVCLPRGLSGAVIIDPMGDFIDVYEGPENGDLDVLRAEVFLDPAAGTLRFTSTSAADIGITDTAIFVWGINRGAGFVNFANIGLPNVMFDAVVIITAGGNGFVTTLDNGNQTNLPSANITIDGPDISATVPVGLLPSLGFEPTAYTVNIWPRSEFNIEEVDVISDFAPDDVNAAVTVVPEPATFGLLGFAITGLLWARRYNRRPS